MQTEVIMTGIGGQGIQLCAKVLAVAATNEGRQALLSAHYGGEMRGGQTEASVVVGEAPLRSLPILPSTWSAFVMHPRYWPSVRERLRHGGVVVFNSSIEGMDVEGVDARLFPVPADDVAASVGAPMGAGFVLLGAYSAITDIVGVELARPSHDRAGPLLPCPAHRRQPGLAGGGRLCGVGPGVAAPPAAPAWSLRPVRARPASARIVPARPPRRWRPMRGVLTRGTVVIDVERCKGCELCIPACPPGVLVMSRATNATGYRYPLLRPGCTGCQACHAVCPDYVFEVYKFDEPILYPDEEGGAGAPPAPAGGTAVQGPG